MDKLYCSHCGKTYSVNADDIRLMREEGKTIHQTSDAYRFEAGCFFKELALLKRRRRNAPETSQCLND